MFKDPVVAEVRKNREILAAKFNYNIKDIISDAQNRQNKSKRKTVFFNRNKKYLPKNGLHSTATKNLG